MNKEDILAKMQEVEKTTPGADEAAIENQDGEGTETPDDYKALYEAAKQDKERIEKASKSALIQKDKYKAILESIAGEISEDKKVDEPKVPENLSKEEFKVEMFKIKHPELSEEDVDTLHKMSKATGKTLEETMQTPIFKTYIDKVIEDKRVNNAIPNFTGRSAVSGNEKASDKAFQDLIISKFPKNMQKYFNKDKK